MKRPSILFATIAAGGSHVSTANAMSQALARHFPGDFQLSVRELMPEYGFVELDRRHKEQWKRALRHPWTIVWGQRLIDSLPAASVALHRRLLADFARRAATSLNEERPDLVVVNHGWLTVALTMAQLRFGLEVPVVTFETSTLNANALWAEKHAERFIVASPVSRRRLQRFGIPGERIDIVGYPVREQFLLAPAKSQARARLGIADEFTLLVSLGGEGVGGKPEEVLGNLAALGDVQTLVIAGRNDALRERLERLSEERPGLRAFGFVDDMATFVAASDVVIGKSGPATAYETMAVGRPLLAPSAYGLAENKLMQVLEGFGLGGFVPDAGELLRRVDGYRRDPEELARASAAAARFDFPGMAERLARYLAHYATNRSPLPEACGKGLPLGDLPLRD